MLSDSHLCSRQLSFRRSTLKWHFANRNPRETGASKLESNCLPKACANRTPGFEDLATTEHGSSIGLFLQVRPCDLSRLAISSAANSASVCTDEALATSRFKGEHFGSWKLRMFKVFPSLTEAKGGKTLSYILRKMAFPALTSMMRPHSNLNQEDRETKHHAGLHCCLSHRFCLQKQKP